MPDYLFAIVEHARGCREDLDALAKTASIRSLNRMERRAAERALQVLIEACIGVAKYWLKQKSLHLPLNAYQCFAKLSELQVISIDDLKQWRRIIGMRNALVHDYLNIDLVLLHQIISEKAYMFLLDFIELAEQQLAQQ